MRELARVLVFVLVFQSIGIDVMAQAVAATPNASQARVEDPAWPDRFGTGPEGEKRCIAALQSRQYRIYVPEDLRGTWRTPLDDKVHFRLVIARDACAHMKIETGKKEWVPQKADTVFRATRVKGIAVIYARDDCGNETDAISYPPLKLTVGPKGDKGDTGPQGIPGLKGDNGDKGDPGKDAVVPPPTSTRSNKKWWLLGVAGVVGAGAAYAYSSCVFCKCPPGFQKAY